jgi:hypothetical protein
MFNTAAVFVTPPVEVVFVVVNPLNEFVRQIDLR